MISMKPILDHYCYIAYKLKVCTHVSIHFQRAVVFQVLTVSVPPNFFLHGTTVYDVHVMVTCLMQFLGSLSQSMLQRYRSHANHPMGGVLISPLSRAKVVT